ncbi:MAG: hypothetical protein IPK03_05475 [Bacteroidetes bacterium]|nr:hypothetical protein [Bacteroidota bacterium]
MNIDKALVNTNPKRVSIIITDLFYKGQDINSVVSAINESCIKKGIDIGVLSVSSIFTGIVADVNPPVLLPSQIRPLHVLILGSKSNITQVFEAFKSKPYVNSNQKLLITKHPLENYEVNVEKYKDKTNSAINSDQGKVAPYKDFGNVFGFRLKEKDKAAYLSFELNTKINEAFPKFKSENLKFTVFKKVPNIKDSTENANDLVFEDIKVLGGEIKGKIRIENKDKSEALSYLINVGFDKTVPMQTLDWIKKYDTEIYTSFSPKDKTIYLNKLFTEIATFNTTYK